VTTSEFNDVKARLARIQNKRKLRDGPDSKKPSLRKASNGSSDGSNSGSGNGNSTGDSERPTLHPRDSD